MTATVELPNGKTATIKNFKWTSADEHLADWLNLELPYIPPGPENANPDLWEAERAAKRYGAKVIEFDVPPFDPMVIY